MLKIGWTCHMIGSPVLALEQPRQARLGRCEWNHLGIDCGGSRAKRVGGKKKSPAAVDGAGFTNSDMCGFQALRSGLG